MTPKEQYEARKAERARQREAHGRGRSVQQDEQDYLALLDMADRFVTAAERIADALEAADLGHAGGYALRLRGVTTDTAQAEAKK